MSKKKVLAGMAMASAIGAAGCDQVTAVTSPYSFVSKTDEQAINTAFANNIRHRLVEAYRAGEIDISFQEIGEASASYRTVSGGTRSRSYRTPVGDMYRLDADPANLAYYEQRTKENYTESDLVYSKHKGGPYSDQPYQNSSYKTYRFNFPVAGKDFRLVVTDARSGLELCDYTTLRYVRANGSVSHDVHQEIADIARDRLAKKTGTDVRDVTAERAAFICEQPVEAMEAKRIAQMLVPSTISGPSRPDEGAATPPTNHEVSDGKGGSMVVPVVAGLIAGRAIAGVGSETNHAQATSGAENHASSHRARSSRGSARRR